MDDTRSLDAAAAADTMAPDGESQLDDLKDLDSDEDDRFEPPSTFEAPDELEHLGGYSESTAVEEPPPD